MSFGRLRLVSGLILSLAMALHFSNFFDGSAIILMHSIMAFLVSLWLFRRGNDLPTRFLAFGAFVWALAQFMRMAAIDVSNKLDFIAFALALANALLFFATAKAQDSVLPRQTRTIRTIEGLLLALSVLALEWFFTFETNALNGFNGISSRREEFFFLAGQLLSSLPFIAVLLFLMNSTQHQRKLAWATLGVICSTSFSVTWFNVKVYATGALGSIWDLIAMAGIFAFSLALTSRTEGNAGAKVSLPLSLLPNILGVLTIITGVIHALVQGLHLADLVIVAGLGIILIIRQTYSYIDQERLMNLVSRHESQMRHLVMHDPLTSLANRALFQDRLTHAVATRQRDGSEISLIHIDIDNFKKVNDQFGHLIGDEVLMHVARRLSTWVRPSDTVARLGGDEFAILMEANPEGARRVADRIATELSRPFDLASQQINVSASIGLATFRPAETQGEDPIRIAERLVNKADRAMHSAKMEQRGGVVVHQEPNSTSA